MPRRSPRTASPRPASTEADVAVLRHEAGGRGPRGGPRLSRRREAPALRRELRHAVRPDVRRRAPRPDRDALPRRPGRPDRRRPDLLRRGGAERDGHARRDPRRVHGRGRRCKADVRGGDALAVYDALAARLATGPITFDYPLADGTTVQRELTANALEYGAFYYIYSRGARALLQRAIAAASHDNFVPAGQALLRQPERRSGHARRPARTRPGPTPRTTRSSARTTRSIRRPATRTPG